jgi:LacI family gluconate utilization system Gnt-I transcriptional repressor
MLPKGGSDVVEFDASRVQNPKLPFPQASSMSNQRRSSRASSHVQDGRTPTLADVAKLAGVSPITVSRTLNQPEIVRPVLREKVLRAIRKLGYVPAMMTGGGIGEHRNRLVSILVPTIANSIFADTIHALMETLTQANYQTIIGLTNYSPEREEQLLDAILRRRPDGIVLTGTLHTDASRERLSRCGIPIVETWDLVAKPLDMLVGFSHEAVGRAIAAYLLSKGHRCFAAITLDDPRGHLRHVGLLAELKQHGIRDVPQIVLPPPATVQLGREGLGRLLDQGMCPDVVVCSSDTLAHGVLEEATERNLPVPASLAVMGFGDLSTAAHLHPALTTVNVNGTDIGARAAHALLKRLEPVEDSEKLLVDTGFTVVVRQSA